MFILPDFPFKAPMELIDPTLALTTDMSVADRIRTALGTVGTQLTPIIKSPIEWFTQRNIWKGYNFDGRYQQVPTVYEQVPLFMNVLDAAGLATKQDDKWLMRDYDLHSVAQMLPLWSDLRRLFPDEQRYQERTLSSWISFVFGIGLRTSFGRR